MKPYVWQEGMSDQESKDGAYWERNMLALLYATEINAICINYGFKPTCGWYYDTDNDWDNWKRVISLENGKYTFHIPDDFDTGALIEIEPNWDGHTTEEKWIDIMDDCGCIIE